MTLRVLAVEDHRMFAEALELLLAGQKGIEMVGAVASGEEAVEFVRRETPDVVLMDVDLPGMDGIEATRRVKELWPETQIVIITAFQEREVIARAVQAGATGYVPKTEAADRLLDIIRRAATGEMVLPSEGIGAVLSRLQEVHQVRSDAQLVLDQLTKREVEILQAIAEGKTTPEIAGQLFISPLTVQTHVKNILAKLGVHSKLEAVTFALRHGIIQISPTH